MSPTPLPVVVLWRKMPALLQEQNVRLFSFTGRQLSTFNAVADRIVPPDQTIGAAEAGAATFILSLLNGELCGEQDVYAAGLDAIEQEALAFYSRSFNTLSADQQDTLLREIEANQIKTAWLVDPLTFFQNLVERVLEGFYADPGNGGNQDSVSWQMIGYRAEGGTW